jgi:phospholipid/cholesterol/gamma-HCH transport system substrate-binding protein
MQKQAPSLAKIAAMVAFALSCFALLVFLWVSFGGPTPIKPKGYRFEAVFEEAPLLVSESDVRISGLNVGKVKKLTLEEREGATLVEMEIDAKYAPIPSDTRATLRPKSILGQTYVELTPGSKEAPPLADGGRLRTESVQESVEIDEVIRTFDRPTRRAFQGWVRELAVAIDGRSEDLNDAIGNLEPFVANGRDVLRILDEEEPALRQLVRNASIALGAVNERQGQLRELITNADRFFGATASRNEALADAIFIFPTFLDESRLTIARLERFSRDARPLVRDLQPVARELRPTLANLGALAPDLEALFRRTDPLIRESGQTLPHAARFLRGAEPVLANLHPYLQELNPIVAYLNYQQEQVSDFIMNGANTLNATLPAPPGRGPRHYLRQYGVTNARSLGIQTRRPEYDRGNAYPIPNYSRRFPAFGAYEAFDCKPSGEQRDPAPGLPPCFVQGPHLYDGNNFPRLERGDGRHRDKPLGIEGSRPADANRGR